jgi:hypothetical protein
MEVDLAFVAPERDDGSLMPYATPLSRGADVLAECRRQGISWDDAWDLAVEMVMHYAREADGDLVDDSDLVAFTSYKPTYRASYHRLPQPSLAYDPHVKYDYVKARGSRVETHAR